MFIFRRAFLRRAITTTTSATSTTTTTTAASAKTTRTGGTTTPSSPSVSIWRRKKDIGKEGLIVAKEIKRLQLNPTRLQKFIQFNVNRLLKSDLVSVLAKFQRQDQNFLSMKRYALMMLARNKKVEEAKLLWADLKSKQVLFDKHTFGDIMRVFLDNGLPNEAMEIYDEMRQSPDPPLSLPYRVILKGLIPYPELRKKVKDDFLELFPDKLIYDPREDLFEKTSIGNQKATRNELNYLLPRLLLWRAHSGRF